jgi:hypothetical protein
VKGEREIDRGEGGRAHRDGDGTNGANMGPPTGGFKSSADQ